MTATRTTATCWQCGAEVRAWAKDEPGHPVMTFTSGEPLGRVVSYYECDLCDVEYRVLPSKPRAMFTTPGAPGGRYIDHGSVYAPSPA